MSTTAINSVIENFHHLNMDDREYVFEIINKLMNEDRRERIFQRAAEAEKNYENGKVKTGGIQELFRDMEDD